MPCTGRTRPGIRRGAAELPNHDTSCACGTSRRRRRRWRESATCHQDTRALVGDVCGERAAKSSSRPSTFCAWTPKRVASAAKSGVARSMPSGRRPRGPGRSAACRSRRRPGSRRSAGSSPPRASRARRRRKEAAVAETAPTDRCPRARHRARGEGEAERAPADRVGSLRGRRNAAVAAEPVARDAHVGDHDGVVAAARRRGRRSPSRRDIESKPRGVLPTAGRPPSTARRVPSSALEMPRDRRFASTRHVGFPGLRRVDRIHVDRDELSAPARTSSGSCSVEVRSHRDNDVSFIP